VSLVIGLTGGIGSGKSTVAELFVALGVAVVDTDVIAHELTAANGAAIPEIAAAFGRSVLLADGGLDRAAMRRLVFSDPSQKSQLEAILHPLIRRESEARCQQAVQSPYVLLVIPLLVESGARAQRVDRVLLVDCDEALQLSRVMTRSGLSLAEAQSIMASQATRAQRLAVADDVLFNDGRRDELSAQVLALHRRYLDLAARTYAAGILNADC
jgi:dephospho-CoA kinase